jgi:signal recognition particle subunit SRP19
LRRKAKLYLWPSYFDTDLSWRQGRRVPKKLSLRDVNSEEVLRAANELGLNPVLEPGAAFSKRPWFKTDLIMVDKSSSKTEILRDLAEKIRQNRASR